MSPKTGLKGHDRIDRRARWSTTRWLGRAIAACPEGEVLAHRCEVAAVATVLTGRGATRRDLGRVGLACA